MSEDTRDYIDRTLAKCENMWGRQATPEELAKEFARLPLADRAEELTRMGADNTREFSTAKEAARNYRYERAMRDMHDRLRKIDR